MPRPSKRPPTQKSSVFWNRTPCSSVKVSRCFGGSYHLNSQGRGVSQSQTLFPFPISPKRDTCPAHLIHLVPLSLSMALQPFALWSLFQFLNLYTVGTTPWTGDQPVARPLPTYRTTQTQNKRTQTSMPRVGFEPTTPVFEWAKTFHALDRAGTVVGSTLI
jgi:hypothetical protein